MSDIANEILNLTRQLDKNTQALVLAATELVAVRKEDAASLERLRGNVKDTDRDRLAALNAKLDAAQADNDALKQAVRVARDQIEALQKQLLETRIAASKIIQDDVIIADVVAEEPVKK